jgi:hypothetical protein
VPKFQPAPAPGTVQFSPILGRDDAVVLHVFVIEVIKWTTTPPMGWSYQTYRVVCSDWTGASASIFASGSRMVSRRP